jgi:hypothetical protein
MNTMNSTLRAAFASLLVAAGCAGTSEPPASEEDVTTPGAPSLCAAVRGNGELIGAHFPSLARVVETYGVVDGMAGGSSASITTFLYESILLNPAVSTCGDRACSKEEKSARVALMLKSILGYGEVVATSDEATVVRNAVEFAIRIKAEAEAQGALAVVSPSNAVELAGKLKSVLSIPEIRALVNPELLTMLTNVTNLAFNVAEVQTAIKTLGAFSVDENRLFFRRGALNWEALATLMGRVGDFYAGYAPARARDLGVWLDECSAKTAGMGWEEASKVRAATGTCGEAFGKAVVGYRAAARASNATPKRLSERVGGTLHALISTSVLEGDAARQFEAAKLEYQAGKYPTGRIASFSPAFEDVKFGYWGQAADLAKLMQNPKAFGDEKTNKRTSLGSEATWAQVLRTSPAEPGLSALVALPDGRISAGGWSDLAPVLALKNIGCTRVVYVQRKGDESIFAAKIAKQLGMGEGAWNKLYNLSDDASGYAQSVKAADAVWCTNWNAFEAKQQYELARDAYGAPFEIRGLSARKPRREYSGATTDSLGVVGCSAGVRGTKSWADVVAP